jgi:hypothetical protein
MVAVLWALQGRRRSGLVDDRIRCLSTTVVIRCRTWQCVCVLRQPGAMWAVRMTDPGHVSRHDTAIICLGSLTWRASRASSAAVCTNSLCVRALNASSASMPPAALISCICSGDSCHLCMILNQAMDTSTCGVFKTFKNWNNSCLLHLWHTLACFANASHERDCTSGTFPSPRRAMSTSVVAGLAKLPRLWRKELSGPEWACCGGSCCCCCCS